MNFKSTWAGVGKQEIHVFNHYLLSAYYVLDTRAKKNLLPGGSWFSPFH